jgi:hypothetical protein
VGDHREQLVDIGSAASESTARAAQVLGWLRDSGWSREDRRAGDDLAHGLFTTDFAETDRAGARFRERFPGVEDDTVVTVLTAGGETATWDAREGTGPPDCGRWAYVHLHD